MKRPELDLRDSKWILLVENNHQNKECHLYLILTIMLMKEKKNLRNCKDSFQLALRLIMDCLEIGIFYRVLFVDFAGHKPLLLIILFSLHAIAEEERRIFIIIV